MNYFRLVGVACQTIRGAPDENVLQSTEPTGRGLEKRFCKPLRLLSENGNGGMFHEKLDYMCLNIYLDSLCLKMSKH